MLWVKGNLAINFLLTSAFCLFPSEGVTGRTETTAGLEYIKLIKFMQYSPCLSDIHTVQKSRNKSGC